MTMRGLPLVVSIATLPSSAGRGENLPFPSLSIRPTVVGAEVHRARPASGRSYTLPREGQSTLSRPTTCRTKSGNLLTGDGSWTSVETPVSSIRLSQAATVWASTRMARAARASDQPRAVLSSRIAMRWVGGYMRPAAGSFFASAGVLDAKLLAQKGDLLLKAVVLDLQDEFSVKPLDTRPNRTPSPLAVAGPRRTRAIEGLRAFGSIENGILRGPANFPRWSSFLSDWSPAGPLQ